MVTRRSFMKLITLMLAGCVQRSGVDVMFAASLQKEMEDLIVPAFREKTGIPVQAEARGSVTIVNLIRDGYRRPDIVISADSNLLDELKPEFIERYAVFASNSIVIAHRGVEIDEDEWIDGIISGKYRFGISDPESDPLGYRSLIVLKLAEMYYGREFYDKAMKNLLIFGLETDLAANIKAGTIDAGFLYRNMALAHNLDFIELPEQIDLSSPDYEEFYEKALVQVGDRVHRGKAILYGIAKTVWSGRYGEEFLKFMLSDGLSLLNQYGLKTMVRWI